MKAESETDQAKRALNYAQNRIFEIQKSIDNESEAAPIDEQSQGQDVKMHLPMIKRVRKAPV